MDIEAGTIAIVLLLILFAIGMGWAAFRSLRSPRQLPFYRLRRQRNASAVRLFGLAAGLLLVAAGIWVYGEPLAFEYFPPSPTVTLTPSITLVPSITLTASITLTPSVTLTPARSATPTYTATPFLPLPIIAVFQSSVTPNANAAFSPIRFAQQLNYPPSNTSTVFQNPVGHLYGIFSYDKMTVGAQWTAIWYRDGMQVNLDTHPWNCSACGSGGWGETDWNPPPYGWVAGNYEVQIYVGEEYKTNGRFIVRGNPPPSPGPSPTATPVFSATPSATSQP
jgi:hypothetical protein